MRPRLISTRPVWPLLLIGAALRLVNLHAPVLGVHSWRQADTAAIARREFFRAVSQLVIIDDY